MHFLRGLLAVLCLAGLALGQGAGAGPAKKSALDKKTLEEFARHLFVWGPPVTVQVGDPKPAPLPNFMEVPVRASMGNASQEDTFYVSKDGQYVLRGMVFDIAKNPFEGDLNRIKTDGSPSFGTPGAPVVIVMYSDFQCGYCREEAKMVRANLISTYPKEVRVYFKDFPLEQIHPWARSAAIAGRCVFRQKPAAFWDYHDYVFEHQGEIKPENLKEKVMVLAKDKGIETLQLGACIDNKETNGEVDRSLAEGRSLQINSTPTIFINGRKLVGQLGWPQLRQIIDHEIEYQKTHGGGEQCCEVKLPSPLNNK